MSNQSLKPMALNMYLREAFGDTRYVTITLDYTIIRQFFTNYLNHLPRHFNTNANVLLALGTAKMREGYEEVYGIRLERWLEDPIYKKWLKYVLLRKMS